MYCSLIKNIYFKDPDSISRKRLNPSKKLIHRYSQLSTIEQSRRKETKAGKCRVVLSKKGVNIGSSGKAAISLLRVRLNKD